MTTTAHHREFSWDEWCNAAEAETAYVRAEGQSSRNDSQSNNEWAGCSWSEAVQRARFDGYSEVLPEIERVAHAVEDKVLVDRALQSTFTAVHDVCGSEVDISAFLGGVPECMIESVPIKIARTGRAIRIAVSTFWSAGTDESAVRTRGAAVVALLDILARLQHPLEVWAVYAGTNYAQERISYSVCVQRPDEPLDIGRVAFALGHVASFRRIGFSVLERDPQGPRFGAGSYYTSGHGNEVRDTDLPSAYDGTTIKLDRVPHAAEWTVPAAVAWVEAQLDTIFG